MTGVQHDGEVAHATDVSLFTSDETDEWATPPEFLRPLADAVGGFDLDAASGAETSPIAEHAYTEDDDGLAQPWFGTVWCNPPYSEMAAWTDKVVSELHREEVDAILYLCKGDTSTDWWHQALAEATAVGMLDTRLSFGDGTESAPFASHVFVFGDAPDAVLDALNHEGAVFDAADKHERSEQRKLVTDGGTDQFGDGIGRGDGPLADTSLLTEGRQRAPQSDRPVLFARDDRPRHDRVVFWEGGRLFGDRWIIVDGESVEEVGESE